jgi:hypothetical protein
VPTVAEITEAQIAALVEAAEAIPVGPYELQDEGYGTYCLRDGSPDRWTVTRIRTDPLDPVGGAAIAKWFANLDPQTILALVQALKQAQRERDAASAEAAQHAAALRVAVTYHADGLIALGATDGQPVMIDREQLIERGIKRALEQAAQEPGETGETQAQGD